MDISKKAQELKNKLVERRRDIHKHPEPGWTEFRTASLAIEVMQSLGYTITMGEKAVKKSSMMGVPSAERLKQEQERAIAEGANPDLVNKMTGGLTGFWADMKFSDDGPRVALRVDMDCVDTSESTDSDHRPVREGFASIHPGAMHACGHDGHTTMATGIAEVIAGMKDKLKGSVRFIFQSAEEGLRGARPMVDAGAVDGIDYILGMHLGFHDCGGVSCGGEGFLASTKSNITFKGVSSHAGNAPHMGKNALMAACCAAMNLFAISRHGDGVTRINVGKVIAGEGRNVIAPNGYLEIETRGATTALKNYMDEEVARIIKAAADMYGCTYEVELAGGADGAVCDQKMIDIVRSVAETIPYYKRIDDIGHMGGGEDYTIMLNKVQENGGIGTVILLGGSRTAPLHNSRLDFDENEMVASVELVSKVFQKLLS